ncbi:unnamed protein product [Eruca vesicaria subsp. sativa]|uniref:Uncharacterized protein n=1 Tax=Eruca vesicaria subsp. sativa TaxID=29727 RepID=A0ABC8J713_ERUVS|nr:unnamed protein product [Eruca vesicaria subsp. sativa]
MARPMKRDISGSGHDIDALLQRGSSPSSLQDQTVCTDELAVRLRHLPMSGPSLSLRSMIRSPWLLSPLSALAQAVDSNPSLQNNIITSALLYISSAEENKTVVSQNPLVIPLRIKSLKQCTAKTRRKSAATLLSLVILLSTFMYVSPNYQILD